jgi:hypothetical protein
VISVRNLLSSVVFSTTILLIADGSSHLVQAQSADILGQTAQNPTTVDAIPYQASDLMSETIANVPLDLDVFCVNYPYNSRCEGYTPGSSEDLEEALSNDNSQSSASSANSAWAIGADIGTLGGGANVTRRITPKINVRGGINGFTIGTDVEDTDVKYNADLTLINVSTLLDYHPIQRLGFRLTGGLIFNDNKISGSGQPSGGTIFTFNGEDYQVADVGSVDADISFGSPVAPYIGIGWGNAVKPNQRWGFSANLGVMFPGSPDVNISANPNPNLPAATRTQLESDIKAEENKLEDDLDFLTVYPVLSVGVTYHF